MQERVTAWKTGVGLGMAVWLGLLSAAPGEGAPARAGRRAARTLPAPRAIVTHVAGDVVVLRGKRAGRRVAVGAELPKGTRLRLGKASRLTALWPQGERTVLRGPSQVTVLKPGGAPKRAASSSSPSVLGNVWKALRARLGGSHRKRAAMTEEPLAVRGSHDEWQVSPDDEQVRPGPVTLSWRDPSASSGQYLVIVWDEHFAEVWKATTQEHTIAVPDSLGLQPGHRYRWVVSSSASLEASPVRWFALLTPDRARDLDDELACARSLFGDLEPPSQGHVAAGCIYERYGLLSEARAEYAAAARLSPGVAAYQSLAGQPNR